MPKHITETARKDYVDAHPEGVPAGLRPLGGQSRLNRDEILNVAAVAWDRQKTRSVTWKELDAEAKRRYFDIAVDICERGGASSGYELLVEEACREQAAGKIKVPEAVPTPAPVSKTQAQVVAEVRATPKPAPAPAPDVKNKKK
jgi:hypothetical protein